MTMQLVEQSLGLAESIRVTAAPFQSFTQVAAFQKSIARLHGVQGVRVGRVQQGVLVLNVDYDGLIPLHVRLRDLRDVRWTLVQVAQDAVEIAVA